MKLIDLLVQELPKRGGWPEAFTTQLENFIKKEKLVLIVNSQYSCFEDWDGNRVERDQYEAALASSQKVEWDGVGLPPVGCECEARYREVDGAEWFFFRCVAVDCGVAFGWSGRDAATLGKGSYEFRPLRSEADKKRDAFIAAVLDDMRTIPCDLELRDEVAVIYDAIASGKIPGVKLED